MTKANVLIDIIKRLPKLFIGLFLCAIGISILLTAGIGLNPWGTFTAGLVNITGLSFGRLSQLIGLTIIVLTIPMKVVPGIGTILNMIFIGIFIDFIRTTNLIPTSDQLLVQLVLCIVG